MAKGISLKFNDDNTAVAEVKDDQLPCFGGVVCVYSKRQNGEVFTTDGRQLDVEYWICDHNSEHIGRMENCPLRRWVKLAEPLSIRRDYDPD